VLSHPTISTTLLLLPERKIWQEIVDYLVRVDLDKLGIDEKQFEEMQELFKMFDNDRDGVLSLKEFERLMGVLGRAG
jgi:Ca2+-binding EF-hand superfamily protein